MEKQILQIENLEAQKLLSRLHQIRNDINELNLKIDVSHDSLLTAKETAKFFSVSDVTIWQWTKKGLLTAYKIANRKYYKQSEIENALTEMNA